MEMSRIAVEQSAFGRLRGQQLDAALHRTTGATANRCCRLSRADDILDVNFSRFSIYLYPPVLRFHQILTLMVFLSRLG